MGVAACSQARVGASLVLRPIRLPSVIHPALPHEEVEFRGHGGVPLRGWLFRPEGEPKGLVVYLHGRDANRAHAGVRAARRFVPRGWAVLAYDQRAHGASGGEFMTYGVLEALDLSAALDHVGLGPVVLVGESMGAATAIEAAAEDARIAAVVAAAAFSDLDTILRERADAMGFGSRREETLAEVERLGGFRIADASPIDAASDVRVPVLLLHGTRDSFIRLEHSRRLLAALPQGTKLVRLSGAAHPDVLGHEETWDLIERWVEALDLSGAGTGR